MSTKRKKKLKMTDKDAVDLLNTFISKESLPLCNSVSYTYSMEGFNNEFTLTVDPNRELWYRSVIYTQLKYIRSFIDKEQNASSFSFLYKNVKYIRQKFGLDVGSPNSDKFSYDDPISLNLNDNKYKYIRVSIKNIYKHQVDFVIALGNTEVLLDKDAKETTVLPIIVMCNNETIGSEILEYLTLHFEIKEEDKQNSFSINVSYVNNYGLQTCSILKELKAFKYTDELYPELNVDKLISIFFSSDAPILILEGIPGTGKTSFIRKICVEAYKRDIVCTYTKDENVINNQEFWTSMATDDTHLLIFDDFDASLLKKPANGSSRNNVLNSILTFGQGVFSSFDNKIIIATNQVISNLDDAILRKGRLFDIIKFNRLTREQAHSIWVNVFKQDADVFNKAFNDTCYSDEISQAELVDRCNRITNNWDRDSYLLNLDKQNNLRIKQEIL